MKTHKILVVEDEPALLKSIQIRLSAEGYEVEVAQDGYQALAMAGKQRPDLLILDVHIPAGDGFSVEARVRKMPGMLHVPIIYVTGDASQTLIDKAATQGVSWLLRKPFRTAELLEIVRQTLDRVDHQEDPLVQTALPASQMGR
ncbi:MAG: response regulator [Planctomycetota bacterium]